MLPKISANNAAAQTYVAKATSMTTKLNDVLSRLRAGDLFT